MGKNMGRTTHDLLMVCLILQHVTRQPETIMKTPITITKHPVTGQLILSAMIDGHLVQRTYMGYTRREAIALFKVQTSLP